MLPLGNNADSSEALEKANQIIWKLFTPAPGKTEPEISDNVARRMLAVLLASIKYKAPVGHRGRITDLSTDERLDLVINTAVCLGFGYRQWEQKQFKSILDASPAQEFYRAYWRENQRNWPERWKAAGGRFFAGESNHPEGRMIALKDDPIWETISAFGLPFSPFDFHSGMEVRDVPRQAAVELGIIRPDQAIQPTTLSASGEFQERLTAKLHENLAKLEADEERRLSDPLKFGTGNELLRLAEEKIEESENLSPEQTRQVMSLVEKAVERGVANNSDGLLADGTPYAALLTGIDQCRSLVFIYEAINEPRQAMFYGQKATKLELARLMSRGSSYDLVKAAEGLLTSTQGMTPEVVKQILVFVERAFEKGVGEKYNLRAKAHKVLAQAYTRTKEFEKAEVNRVQYVENADGFLLLEDAKTELAIAGKTIEPKTSARILDMLAKAVQRLPENCPHLHAEAYRLTAEILEALGDNTRAIEYYEYALLKNPKIAVKRRLDMLQKLRSPDEDEKLVQQCIGIIRSEQKASISLLQRRLHLGYTEAARIMDELENRGIVGPSKGAEPRDILSKP